MTFHFDADELAALVERAHLARDKILTFLAGVLVAASLCMIGIQITLPHALKYQPVEKEFSVMPKSDTQPSRPIPINEQIAIVKRRLMQIENKYPRLVKEHAMTQERATNEIDRFRAVLDTLIRVREIELHPLRAVTTHVQHPLGTGDEQAPYKTGDGRAP